MIFVVRQECHFVGKLFIFTWCTCAVVYLACRIQALISYHFTLICGILIRQTWHLELLGCSIICEDTQNFSLSGVFSADPVLFFFFDSLDGLPFQNEEFDFVYVIFPVRW
jgi:hypothetical protein